MLPAMPPQESPSLRLWPGVVAAIVLVLLKFVLPALTSNADIQSGAMTGGILCALFIGAWWTFLSRAPRRERLEVLAVMALALPATRPLAHPSIRTGMMGMSFFLEALPTMTLALVAWAAISRRLAPMPRRASLFGAVLLGCVVWLPLRTDGVLGGGSEYAWRWTPTAEERLLSRSEPVPPPPAPAAVPTKEAEWPGFRGPARDSVIHGTRIATNWTASPPVELWRRPIGPGWSSFAVSGDVLYTQEQRGEEELVTAYKVSTGEPIWRHSDPVRFWESNAGAGPRATPTLHRGRAYTMGATGILNALDASTGSVVWSHNIATDTGVKLPDWGFSSSPLIADDLVIVAADATLVAYDLATGTKRWAGPKYDGSYSSPQRLTLDGVPQIVFVGGPGVLSVAPVDGKLLWEHSWEDDAIIQPALLANGDLLFADVSATGGAGLRRLAVSHASGKWTTEERWTSRGLKPYFSDFVVHKGHAFGFDGDILGAIELERGERKWKDGRFGYGQLLLLADQDLLLVLSEEGELALIQASPDEFKPLARVPALKGKTWNHPVVVGSTLLVRNGEEMAAFRLPAPG